MKTPLSFRLIGFYATVTTLTAVATLWVGEMIVERQMLRATDLMLGAEHAEIDLLLAEIGTPATPEAVLDAIGDHTLIDAAIFFFQVNGPDGQVLFRSRNLAGQDLPERNGVSRFSAVLASLRTHAHGQDGLPVRVGLFKSGPLRVRIASSLAAHLAVQRQFHTLMAAAVPSVFLLSLAVGWLMSQMMLKPLRAIEDTARRIGARNLKERIAVPNSRDELSRLAELLNHTFDRLEKSFEQVRRFTADSSHELKTPLSIVRLQAEKVLGSGTLDEPNAAAMRDLLEEVTRLERVINQLLLLARAEAETLPLELAEISTRDYIAQFAEDAAALAESENRRFELAENADATARVDASWLRQVLFNLLSNAIRHSPEGGRIRLASRVRGDRWQLWLEDEGPGVPADQLDKIFERFSKATGGNKPDGAGAGLGLAVCRSIIELHHGHIRAFAKTPEQNFRIEISLPLQ